MPVTGQEKGRSMNAIYTCQFDRVSGLWQILSRSGHVLYESADGAYVRSVCGELCAFAARRTNWSPAAYQEHVAVG